MVEKVNLYHGTWVCNYDNIAVKGFSVSKKYNLWLGDGIYFFYEDIFAFKWCVSLYANKKKTFDKENIIKSTCILNCLVNIDKNRIFDLTYLNNHIIFDYFYNKIKNTKNKYSELLKDNKNVQGVILNFLFHEYDEYIGKYDAVKQLYRLYRENYLNDFPASIQGIPQYQLCIKNKEIIEKIDNKLDISSKYDEYIEKWNKLYNVKTLEELNFKNKNLNSKNNYNTISSKYKVGDYYD